MYNLAFIIHGFIFSAIDFCHVCFQLNWHQIYGISHMSYGSAVINNIVINSNGGITYALQYFQVRLAGTPCLLGHYSVVHIGIN